MEQKNNGVLPLVDYAVKKQIPVGAICNATNFMAENGYLDNRKHTGNTLEFARDILMLLKVKPEQKIAEWYHFNKHGCCQE